MKKVIKQMFQCDHCAKWYHREKNAEKHETTCHANPENYRKCLDGCVNLLMKTKTIFQDNPMMGETKRTVELFHCAKIDSFLYPPSVEHKGNAFELGDDFNEPMKKECEHFDDGVGKYDEFWNSFK